MVGQLFADESLVTRQLVDDLLAYKRLDGVDELLHALVDTLLDGDVQRGDSAAALAAVLDTVLARQRRGAGHRDLRPRATGSSRRRRPRR